MDRNALVESLRSAGINDPRVLAAVEAVPRDRFVPEDLRRHAWADSPLPIGSGQTISQPYVVAYMTQELQLTPDSRVLEVGTGSGYQCAILANVAREVWSVEIRPELSERAGRVLAELGLDNVHLRIGDGSLGWPESAPYDAIIVTAACATLPPALLAQLAEPDPPRRGGRLIAPVGQWRQTLILTERAKRGYSERQLLDVRFVPLVDEEGEPQP
ncbi:MAG: protein-L-isoaspartate(D-aspartate) O-methyltransferase [Candidatus Nanopelagicales bacterium]|nr:protein-L-isoaspartate(D-aspartate) O-methyltransferase [Candidatus Nanopelagicales bacterium]